MFSKIFCGNKKIFLILAVLFLNLLLVSPVLAATSTNYVPLVNVPGVDPNAGLLTYLSGLYNFLISVVGILAMAVIIYGGLRYLTSAGNPSSVEEAKDAITSAVTGLILALLSWLILSTINPDILVLKSVGVTGGAGAYSYSAGQNSCVANATGTGTALNPCICIDGADNIYAISGAALVPTVLTLTVSPNPGSSTAPGNSITMSGKLTDSAGKGVSGSIKINKVNTALNASTTFPPVTTKPDGSYSFNYTATCAATDQIQAVYAGDVTYAGSSSTPVSLVVNGMTICTIANYTSSPATASIVSATGGSACQSICSDATLASDNAFHCLVARARIGVFSEGELLTLPIATLRTMATSTGTKANPFLIDPNDKECNALFEGELFSVIYYKPATFDWDVNWDGAYDGANQPYVAMCPLYSALVSASACYHTATPKALVCPTKFKITDNKGNVKEDLLYWGFREP